MTSTNPFVNVRCPECSRIGRVTPAKVESVLKCPCGHRGIFEKVVDADDVAPVPPPVPKPFVESDWPLDEYELAMRGETELPKPAATPPVLPARRALPPVAANASSKLKAIPWIGIDAGDYRQALLVPRIFQFMCIAGIVIICIVAEHAHVRARAQAIDRSEMNTSLPEGLSLRIIDAQYSAFIDSLVFGTIQAVFALSTAIVIVQCLITIANVGIDRLEQGR